MTSVLDIAARFVPVLATLAIVFAVLAATNWFLRRRWQDNPDAQFRFQLIMLALTFSGFLAVIVALPINDALRGQLLSLIGILLSAAIALSSTTFIGNIMAGIMLKVVRNARPGDFITVADLTGRITEMDLLHTEIQTEFRDLVTVPNLYMVTQPLQVVRASGTIITTEVSLGYDVPHSRIETLLCKAAADAGLKDGFVHVRALGDFSVTYRVAGLLEDVDSLISARSALRKKVLDALHGDGVEIVSPNFVNSRPIAEDRVFIPPQVAVQPMKEETTAEQLAFDKAEEAASVEDIRKEIERVEADIAALGKDAPAGEKDELERRKAALIEELKVAEALRKEAEVADETAVTSD